MSDIAIHVENLSKAYRIGLKEQQHETMMGAVTAFVSAPFKNFRDLRRLTQFSDEARADGTPELQISQPAEASVTASGFVPQTSGDDLFWALREVAFEVRQGEAVGIIGRNGAGKSTLLKILSRITEPTSGRARIYGRVASLLEVGTGFHPDLTGRENIYLNGTILGMKKREIDQKLSDMVNFSGVEKFIDTPVKRFSSGMRVRLAFSVAAHLDPEILIVDEVLAVGDAEFQTRCLGKMSEVAGSGRTVLFVSHNMAAVSQLCSRCIVLNNGSIGFDGPAKEGIDHYFKMTNQTSDAASFVADDLSAKRESSRGKFARVEILDERGCPGNRFGIGEPLHLKMRVCFFERLPAVALGIQIYSPSGQPLLNLRSDSQKVSFGPYLSGTEAVFVVKLPGLPVYPGVYKIEPWFADLGGSRIDQIRDGLSVIIESRGRLESERHIQPGRGLLMLDCNWVEVP